MKDIERSTDNKYCRELTIMDKSNYFSLAFIKETKKIQIAVMNEEYEDTNKIKTLPTIPIKDLLWLMNGVEKK